MTGRRSAMLAWLPPWPALAAVAVMFVWAFHNGGYDADTWYWGALVILALLVATAIRGGRPSLPRAARVALLAFGLYVIWSYLSITWARSQGDALTGSNRALLYLLVYALFLVSPWTGQRAMSLLCVFVLGVGLVEVSILVRLLGGAHAASMFVGSRLTTPTGYFNASAALFTLTTLLAITLATRRELPPVLRGLLLAIGCAGLELALLAQSRGWLFTLPIVAVVGIVVVRDRLRVLLFAILPAAGTLPVLPQLLDVFTRLDSSADPGSALRHAGTAALVACAAVFILGTLLALLDSRVPGPRLKRRTARAVGAFVAVMTLAVSVGGAVAATHGHPIRFVSEQWSGFTNLRSTSQSSSHFAQAGSGRYDFWRVALRAFAAHPVGGLGQDNFAEYYITRRHTNEEPAWTHSLELRVLTHTGLVGFALFAAFIGFAGAATLNARRGNDDLIAAVAGASTLPLIVWLLHGTVDWFWEMPALTGPALGFLGLGGGLGALVTANVPLSAATSPGAHATPGEPRVPGPPRRRIPGSVLYGLGALAVVVCTVVLGFPYLAAREIVRAQQVRSLNPAAALGDLSTAADLDPLSAKPGQVGGTIALQVGSYYQAERRFQQAIARDPGGWYAWLGRGLAASALGDGPSAQRDFTVAASINSRLPAVTEALRRVNTLHPVTPAEGLRLLSTVQ